MLADDSREISYLIRYFWKAAKFAFFVCCKLWFNISVLFLDIEGDKPE